ncbi:MAG: M56 family metallopeptidase [Sphingorhabdus sp.]
MIDWLTDTLIATTVLLLLVLLIRRPIARHFGAGMAYALWLLPAARLFMPSLEKVIPASEPVGAEIVTLPVVVQDALTVKAAALAAEPAFDWAQPLLALWLGGAALLFIVQMIRYCLMRDELLSDAVEIDRIGSIAVIESDRVAGPLAFGLFRRFVAVPIHFAQAFNPRERELALAHELAHHRSGDLYANLAAFTFLCLNWFNPVAWLAWNAFRLDQEAACDARVLAGCDAGTKESYGRALARTAIQTSSPLTPTFAMALNHPRTVIERLRRMMMNDTSKRRRLFGRLGLLGATAIALPLTATVVPVFAEKADEPALSEEPKADVRKHKIMMIKKGDGEAADIDLEGDADTPFVKKIEKDGKTIVLRSSEELSEAEVEKMVAEAEKSRAEADEMFADGLADGDRKSGRVIIRSSSKDGDEKEVSSFAWSSAQGAHAIAMEGKTIAAMIPDIDISEFRGNCEEGQPVTSNVEGFDGKNKSRVKIVMCGKGQAKLARVQAQQALREARDEIRDEEDMPDSIRKQVIESLEKQIDKLEKQQSQDKGDGDI